MLPLAAVRRQLRRPIACARSVTRSVGVIPVVSVEIIIVVDVDVPVAPIAVAPVVVTPPRAKRETGAPRQTHSRVVARILIGIVRICWLAINHDRIVRRNVDNLRVGLLDHDHLFPVFGLRFDFLLGAGF
jgi:hypothetical protein